MNNILSIKVDDTLESGTRAKKSAEIVLKNHRNEQNLGLNIINGYPVFETLRKMHGYKILSQLSITIYPQSSNVKPLVGLII